jgi:hypothetical protein
MTLILNEIHLLDGMQRTMLVAAADRRISRLDGTYDSTRQKLFSIPYLDATVSYFGIACVYPGGKTQPLSDWLPYFISTQSAAPDLQTFAESLRVELHKLVPQSILESYPSGFHLCGYNRQRLPEFWYLSNIGGMQNFQHVDFKPQYEPASSDFLGRDARKHFGWYGIDPSSAKNGVCVYRNGDFRAHVAAWETLDEIYKGLLRFPDFNVPQTPQEYALYVKFKFEVVAYFYRKWARKKIIDRPIDVIVSTSW